ncbi:hypothetical protein GH733_001724, partial [Mirounga leonina]
MLCEEKSASLHDAALLDILYILLDQHQEVWDVFQMSKGPDKDLDLFDMEQFECSLAKILQRVLENVTVCFRDAEESATWTRIAWGTQYRKPNQYKPAYSPHLHFLHQLKSNTPLLALTSLASAGITDVSLSPFLTCIPQKGMNYFKIR